jgi:formate-dependent nitrite reductase cytochrome c552 subunit
VPSIKHTTNVKGGVIVKRIRLSIVLALAGSLFFAWASFGADEGRIKAPEAEIIIEGEKKSARFSHPVHLDLGVTCAQCHHDSERQPLTDKDIAAMENSLQLRCASCHNKDFSNPKLQSAKNAFHARCKECHKKGVDGKTGPTKCKGCHLK